MKGQEDESETPVAVARKTSANFYAGLLATGNLYERYVRKMTWPQMYTERVPTINTNYTRVRKKFIVFVIYISKLENCLINDSSCILYTHTYASIQIYMKLLSHLEYDLSHFKLISHKLFTHHFTAKISR